MKVFLGTNVLASAAATPGHCESGDSFSQAVLGKAEGPTTAWGRTQKTAPLTLSVLLELSILQAF